MVQFGSSRIILRDSTFTGYELIELGWVQSGSVDISYEMAQLWAAGQAFPVDLRYHSGRVTGRGSNAQLTSVGFAYMVGGTLGSGMNVDQVTISGTSFPRYWSLEFRLVTDTVDYILTLNRCTSGRLSWEYARDNWVLPEFEFSAFADSNGVVCTIDVGAVS